MTAMQAHIEALQNLRIGVDLDRQNLDDGEAKLAALDTAIAALAHVQQPSRRMPRATATTEPIVVVFPRSQLTELDKARLDEAGIVAVEADSPDDVQQLRLATPLVCTSLTGDAIVRAALKAIAGQTPAYSNGSITAAGKAAHDFVSMLSASMENDGNG